VFILPLVFLWGGGQGIYTVLTNRKPLVMTFAEYAEKRPDVKWVELKDTQLDLTDATFSGLLGSVSEVYIPLHPKDAPSGSKIPALLLTRDAEVLDLVREMKALPDEKTTLEFFIKNRERLFPVRDVRGLLQFGIESSDKKRRKVAALNDNLTADFVVVEEGKRPEVGSSLFFVVAGFVAMWLCWFRKSGTKSPPPLPAQPPPMPQ
jgi:hypothetical protein